MKKLLRVTAVGCVGFFLGVMLTAVVAWQEALKFLHDAEVEFEEEAD